jgi:hypothetical protein
VSSEVFHTSALRNASRKKNSIKAGNQEERKPRYSYIKAGNKEARNQGDVNAGI